MIFDRAFKKILTLSSKAVTNMINGLFNTNYDPDTKQQRRISHGSSENLWLKTDHMTLSVR